MRLETNQQQRQFWINSTIYIGSFLLFWEWLIPLNQITDTGNVSIFVLYTMFCFFLSYMQIQWWITSPLKLFGMLFILDGLFFSETFLTSAWFQHLFNDIQWNIDAMLSQQWWEMTSLYRSLLFLILLWLMSYLLYYWFVIAKRTLFFVVLTLIYLTVVDTFTLYDAKYAIIRTFVISMIILGITNVQRIMIKERLFRLPKGNYLAWALPLITLVLFSGLVGYAAPKFNPQWPDPVPFIQSSSENATGNAGSGTALKKVGYGENDERLGGSFIQDHTLVFEATVEDAQYWKIETKDVYTGKGWVRSEFSKEESFTFSDDGTIHFADTADTVETQERQGTISFNEQQQLPKLVYPYGITDIQSERDQSYSFSYNPVTGEIYSHIASEEVPMNQYSVSYDQPTYSLKALREAGQEDPQNIKDQYTQIPESLPSRVGELAHELTAEETNRYDQAKAIEDYFNSSDFQYRTTNVPVPGENEDYVDQFLFESKVGYCDNFSTSMVMLLRSVDIPARWVKGFAPGEIVDRSVDGNTYEITNSNAHSWVEVYFPEIGWVPFEPTKGFYNPVDFTSGEDLEELTNQEENEDIPVSQMENEPPEQEEEETKSNFSLNISILPMVILGLIVLSLLGILYWKRYTFGYWLKSRQFRKNTDIETYMKAYHFLLSLLKHKGYKRGSDQTLREYARMIDNQMRTNEMGRLTNSYERILYRDDQNIREWNRKQELWENLIKRILS
ncbi:Transglutaminase-like superfamily protein [Salinibacillus kushneri]|uniref:Transglutaminase-like superfamily protein n=1 Tax=Salinibacillus kushneri TaxID=237682 RepID=A0A1I0J6W9_9BACI|nr:transglutaminase domain-containing protein [Salinibacillus kushneri]SEU05598.1 Transglutaminase-like superfamily protein [Salinibacillus kushneri]